jgi:DNA helicase II / ATP-dependent DNA helicase PcrA
LYDAVSTLAGAAGQKIGAFVQLIERLRRETQSMPLPEVIEHVIDKSGLITFYGTEKEGQERIENLKELINAAAAYLNETSIAMDTPANVGVSQASQLQANNLQSNNLQIGESQDGVAVFLDADSLPQASPLAGFLAHASLESGESQAGEGTEAIQLMTVHSAKGLEFDAVFMTGLEEGLFPHENSTSEEGGLEEERRLMYVAITRARQRLYLSFCQTRMLHGQTRYNLKSRFIDELPPGSLKWLSSRTRMGLGGSAGYANKYSGTDGKTYGDNNNGFAGAPRAGSASAALPYRVGSTVQHARFGDGIVVRYEGNGDDSRIQINFGSQGVKWLALNIAKLSAA